MTAAAVGCKPMLDGFGVGSDSSRQYELAVVVHVLSRSAAREAGDPNALAWLNGQKPLALVITVNECGHAPRKHTPAEPPALKEVQRVVQIFRELRSGQTEDGKTRIKSPTSTLSSAEAISVINSGMALAGHFGDGVLRPADMAAGLIGAVIKDPVQDQAVWTEYLETVVKERGDWKDLYRAFRELS